MKKQAKEHYEEIVQDLLPVFEKWGEETIVAVMWSRSRRRNKLRELEKQKQEVDEALTKLNAQP